MLTVTQQKAAYAQARKDAGDNDTAWLDAVKASAIVEHYAAEGLTGKPPAGVIRGNADYRGQMRDLVTIGKAVKLGFVCDHCGTEIIARRPGVDTKALPAWIEVGCIGCGWIETLET